VPVVVHAGRAERMHAHDAAAFAHLQDEGVGNDESERPGVGQGAGAELLHVESNSLAISDTWDFDSVVIPSEANSLSIRRVDTPSKENLFKTVRYVSPSLRHEITWLVLLSIIVLTGVGALCFGWWLPGVILIVGGGAPAGAVLRASSLSARWSDPYVREERGRYEHATA
jgi:hypothetical protein